MKKSVVYTKTGDKGVTGLIGGTRVPKNHVRLEAYGTVDELNSCVGTIRSYQLPESDIHFLVAVQSRLFSLGGYLATDETKADGKKLISFSDRPIEQLEHEMDRLESALPPLTKFILPGGHPAVAGCHLARTVCRRAERRVLDLSMDYQVEAWVLRYLNRLSDYLFVLSRHLSKYFGVDEIPWLAELED